MPTQAPLNDGIMLALARLVDDSQTETRQPSHSDIEFQFDRFNLRKGDPSSYGRTVGKEKRVRAVLSWALVNDPKAGEAFVAGFITAIRSLGGFRDSSPNYCGEDVITNLTQEFAAEGWEFLPDGILQPRVLESLRGIQLTKALKAYAIRARRGVLDSPLLSGTSKDLLEAVSAHVLVELFGSYPQTSNFPTLLGQSFTELNLATQPPSEGMRRKKV